MNKRILYKHLNNEDLSIITTSINKTRLRCWFPAGIVLFTRTFFVNHIFVKWTRSCTDHYSLFYLVLVVYVLQQTDIRWLTRERITNILISDNIFHKTESMSVLDCFRQCNDNKSCLSISYHAGTHTCFLYSSFNLNKTGKSEEGWCSYSRGNIYVCLILFNAIRNVIDVTLLMGIRIRDMVLNSNFNNISVISWRSVLLVKET
jgi:hypothetical protein